MSIFRKKAKRPEFDATSVQAWSAVREGAFAAQIRLGCEDLTKEGREAIEAMYRQLHLTPASREERLCTPIPAEWSFADYERAVEAIRVTCGALIASGAEGAEPLVLRMNEAMEAYTKKVKRERSMERLSGEASQKRSSL